MAGLYREYWDRKSEGEIFREQWDSRKKVHTDLLWREIQRVIGKQKGLSILDAGGGPGRFSIPLALLGHKIVHVDISANMLGIARQRANEKGVSDIQFHHLSICDPLPFGDGQFDLTLCLDSPLSYCPHNFQSVLAEFTRVTTKSIILCVVNRYGAILEDGGEFDLEHFGKLQTIKDVYQKGVLIVDDIIRKLQPGIMPSWRGFTSEELSQELTALGWQVTHKSAPGTFARFGDADLLQQLYKKPEAYNDYLDFAEEFDKQPSVRGVGAAAAGGLLISAEKSLESPPFSSASAKTIVKHQISDEYE